MRRGTMKETYIGAEIVNVLREALRDVSIEEKDKAGKVAALDGLLRVLDGTLEGLPGPETRLVEELSKLKTAALRWREWVLEMEGGWKNTQTII